MIKDRENIKGAIIDFTVRGVEDFLRSNPGLTFYAFAYDCNSEYGEINLCFNTEEEFAKTLDDYQRGPYRHHYQSEDNIEDLKYNTGDWEHQCFETMYIYSDSELDEIFAGFPNDNYRTWEKFTASLMDLFTECLLDFSETETYRKLPKTTDFVAFCADHNEDFADALRRMDKLKR